MSNDMRTLFATSFGVFLERNAAANVISVTVGVDECRYWLVAPGANCFNHPLATSWTRSVKTHEAVTDVKDNTVAETLHNG